MKPSTMIRHELTVTPWQQGRADVLRNAQPVARMWQGRGWIEVELTTPAQTLGGGRTVKNALDCIATWLAVRQQSTKEN